MHTIDYLRRRCRHATARLRDGTRHFGHERRLRSIMYDTRRNLQEKTRSVWTEHWETTAHHTKKNIELGASSMNVKIYTSATFQLVRPDKTESLRCTCSSSGRDLARKLTADARAAKPRYSTSRKAECHTGVAISLHAQLECALNPRQLVSMFFISRHSVLV